MHNFLHNRFIFVRSQPFGSWEKNGGQASSQGQRRVSGPPAGALGSNERSRAFAAVREEMGYLQLAAALQDINFPADSFVRGKHKGGGVEVGQDWWPGTETST